MTSLEREQILPALAIDHAYHVDKEEVERLLARIRAKIPREVLAESSVLKPYRKQWIEEGRLEGEIRGAQAAIRTVTKRFRGLKLPGLAKIRDLATLQRLLEALAQANDLAAAQAAFDRLGAAVRKAV